MAEAWAIVPHAKAARWWARRRPHKYTGHQLSIWEVVLYWRRNEGVIQRTASGFLKTAKIGVRWNFRGKRWSHIIMISAINAKQSYPYYLRMPGRKAKCSCLAGNYLACASSQCHGVILMMYFQWCRITENVNGKIQGRSSYYAIRIHVASVCWIIFISDIGLRYRRWSTLADWSMKCPSPPRCRK